MDSFPLVKLAKTVTAVEITTGGRNELHEERNAPVTETGGGNTSSQGKMIHSISLSARIA